MFNLRKKEVREEGANLKGLEAEADAAIRNLNLGRQEEAKVREARECVAQRKAALDEAASGPAPDGRAEERNRYAPVRDGEPR